MYNSENNSLEVTSVGSRKHCITIIDLERKQITKTISLIVYSNGITLKNSGCKSCRLTGIQIINLYEETIKNTVIDEMPCDCYITIFGNQICHTNLRTNAVACYNQQNKLQWTFHNENILKSPRGIDEDVNAVGKGSNNGVVISPD